MNLVSTPAISSCRRYKLQPGWARNHSRTSRMRFQSGVVFQRRQRPPPQPCGQLRQPFRGGLRQQAKTLRVLRAADQFQRIASPLHHHSCGHPIAPQHSMLHLGPLNAEPRFALQFPNPRPHLVESLRKRPAIGTAQLQFQRKERVVREQPPFPPQALQLRAQIGRRGPLRAHPARAARSARYSSMVRLRSMEMRPSSLCTKPTLEMKGSMMWIFCSGVTMSSCRSSRANSSSP